MWILFLLGVAIPSFSQDHLQEKYPFLKTEVNRLNFYGDSTQFISVFEKLDKILLDGDGQVNVLHMGGSHVQGGSLSHSMRKHMQSLAPGLKGQRGLIFPFALAHTNNPWNYRVKMSGEWTGARVSVKDQFSHWGISGVTATTTDSSATTKIYAREEADGFAFTSARIFYHMDSISFQPFIVDQYIESSRVDSVAQFIEVTFSQPKDTLQFGMIKKDSIESRFILQGIQLLSDGPAIVYNPIGVNGANTSNYFRSEMLDTQMKMIAPDLVIFGIGINDANTYARLFKQQKYEDNYDRIIALLKEANPDVSIIFMTNNDSYFYKRYPNPNVYKVRDAMINLSKKHNAVVWDMFEIMGGFDSIRIWEAYNLASTDRIHFTREGYELQAELLFSAIKAAFGDYLSARYRQQP
ncbi:MAG: hypothetical protein GY816_04370 [Cytophagales bacterium]|nr:hypothetical protein [Cytophagales bacterium]